MSTLFDALPEALKAVRAKPLFVMRLAVKPLQIIGETPGNLRRIGVFGGSFQGERLSGVVLEGASDWQNVRRDGSVTLDVRMVLKTDDEALIGLAYRGVRHGPVDIIKRMDQGEAVDPAMYYFRTAGFFETAAPQYDWLNRVIAVGTGQRLADGPVYSVFEML
jgi:hypothetical protein